MMEEKGRYGVEEAEQLKNRMKQISGGLENLKARIGAEAEHISELRDMLDVRYLSELSAMLDDVTNRITAMENELNTAIADTDKYRKQFSTEQERLAKLWEAYKKQEDDIEGLKKKNMELSDRIREKDSNISSLQSQIKSLEGLKDMVAYKERYEALSRQYSQMEEYTGKQAQRIKELEDYVKNLEPLKEYIPYKEKVDAISKELELEKERLAKLYKIYEDTDAQLRGLRAELDSWNAWFIQYQDIFTKVSEAANQRKPFVRKPEVLVRRTFEK